MSEEERTNKTPAIITFVILLIGFGFYSDFGGDYRYVNSREQQEIITFIFLIIIIPGVIYLVTKDGNSQIKQITKSAINKQVNNKMNSEITEYIRIVKGFGNEELGLAVLSALTLRKKILDTSGLNQIDLMDPIIALQKDPDITIKLSKKHEELTAQHKPQLTVPYTIWVHTLRSVSNPVIRTLGRQMWKELSRGFKYIEKNREIYQTIYGNEPVSELAGQFPIGLDPSDVKTVDNDKKDNLFSYEKEKKLMKYIDLHKKGLITKEALTNLQVELLSK